MSQAIRYRRDVDGLRAVAVIPIILFHLGLEAIPGGFVGVDIFFVISGFLIGGIVISDLRQDRFSFANFWLRRVRRILPAVTATLLVTTLACLWILLPVDLAKYAKSMIASALSGANIYFQQTTNYFDRTAVERPLLHLWSLGVEEQFYIFFPIVVWVIFRWVPRLMPALVLLGALLSFALSVYMLPRWTDATFYLLPSRAWEFLIGFGVALLPPGWPASRGLREAVAGMGLAAMLCAMFLYDSAMPFPGTAALLPCLGAAAVIAGGAGGPTLVGRMLETRALVWTGLVSFSLYLWHWPLIVLTQYWLPAPTLAPGQQAALFVATYVLAFLSWRWIEHPFRTSKARPAKAFAIGGASMALLCVIGLALIGLRGLPQRFDPAAVRVAATLDYAKEGPFRDGTCFMRSQSVQKLIDAGCVTPATDRPNVLLLGNSHGAHLWAGLASVAPKVNVMQATASGWTCVPVPSLAETPICKALWDYVYGTVIPSQKIDLVIISATWEPYQFAALEQALRLLHARRIPVLFVAPGPQFLAPLPRLLAFSIQRRDPTLIDRFATAEPRRFDAQLQPMVVANGAEFLSAYTAVCHPRCQTLVGDTPLLFDTDHMTVAGSTLTAKAIVATRSWQMMLASAGRRNEAGGTAR